MRSFRPRRLRPALVLLPRLSSRLLLPSPRRRLRATF
jgi:hypothetical protein